MIFGEAIEALKEGKRVARKGWNGKGIFLFITDDAKGYERVPKFEPTREVLIAPFIAIDTTGLQTDNPHAPKSVVPWIASQTDMLAEDWMIVD
jgi:hypothetical protein